VPPPLRFEQVERERAGGQRGGGQPGREQGILPEREPGDREADARDGADDEQAGAEAPDRGDEPNR
jgi:hypothetical protein